MPETVALTAEVTRIFQRRFGVAPARIATAPGRVNLLGEHTDYNGGFVLPMPLNLRVAVAIGPGPAPGLVELYSQNLRKGARVNLAGGPKQRWTDYVVGCLKFACEGMDPPPGFRIVLKSTVPLGAGVSSSAALEVAVLRALHTFLGVEVDDAALAALARRAENEFAGMPCGIMDQLAASLGVPGSALFIDTRSGEARPVGLPGDVSVATVHCGVKHKLVKGGYAKRVRECKAACKALEVAELRDLGVDELSRIADLPEPLNRRARHVVTENARVLAAVEALEAGDAARFGELMVESHASQRDDYEVSIPEIDALAEGAVRAGALGARLTGGGFGGSIVALVGKDGLDPWLDAVARDFPQSRLIAAM